MDIRVILLLCAEALFALFLLYRSGNLKKPSLWAVSVLLLVAVRPLTKKFMVPHAQPTNARSNIGKRAVVTERIDTLNGKGAVKIAGVEWSARSQSDTPIEVGAVVRITDVVGAKVCVELVKTEEEKV